MLINAIFAAHLISTWLMVGIIWFVQIVHYPLMSSVGRDLFRRYSELHQRRTGWVVGGPMLTEAITAVCLLAWSPPLRGSVMFWLGNFLLALIWASTAFWQVPLHKQLLEGYDHAAIQRLARSNWLRTIAWTVRGLLVSRLYFGAASPISG